MYTRTNIFHGNGSLEISLVCELHALSYGLLIRSIRHFQLKSLPYTARYFRKRQWLVCSVTPSKILSTVFKILASDAGSASFRDFITVRRSTYNLRGNTIVDVPKVKSTTYGLRSWRYTVSKMWNSIPDETRKIKTYTVFKKNLRTLYLYGTLTKNVWQPLFLFFLNTVLTILLFSMIFLYFYILFLIRQNIVHVITLNLSLT